jgi:competence protein ComEC
MRLLDNNPFVKLVAVYVTGIMLVTTWLHNTPMFFLFLLVAITLLLLPLSINYLRKQQWATTVVLAALLVISSGTTSLRHHQLRTFVPGEFKGYMRLVKFPEPTDKRLRCELAIKKGSIDSVGIRYPYHILAYLPKTWKDSTLYPGTIFLVNSELTIPGRNSNPFTFNYPQYLYHKGIVGQTFIREGHISKDQESSEINFIHHLRYYCKIQIEQHVPSENSQGLLKALLLGLKKDLPEELQISYARAGAIHMLAVSGLHVGIFFLLIQGLLNTIGLKGRIRWLYYSILLIALFMYAALTGFSPSVCRASLMFGCYTVARWLNRDTQFYNILACSAFLLLVLNPFVLFDVGFQLSYAAVTSIVWLQPKLEAILNPKNKIVRFFWAVTTVSLAAQVGTFPISLYYFHQFPIYFILSNWLAMILVPVLLYVGIIFLILSPFTALASAIGIVLSWLVTILNAGISFIENLPNSTITHIYWQFSVFILVVLTVLLFLHGIVYKKSKLLVFATLSICSLLLWRTYIEVSTYNSGQITLYNCKSPPILSILQQRKAWLITPYSDSLPNDFSYNVEPHLGYNHIREQYIIGLDKHTKHKCKVLKMGEIELAWVYDAAWKSKKQNKALSVDYLILSDRTNTAPDKLMKLISPKLVLLHNSLVTWEKQEYISYLQQENIEYHDIASEGVWQKSVNATDR